MYGFETPPIKFHIQREEIFKKKKKKSEAGEPQR